jgi:formyl-CoA transferase
MLGDLGAEVLKIETPEGDGTRNFPPHIHKGMSIYFMSYNRNKKSVVLNLKEKEGKETFYDLVRKSDIVWDNFRPGIKEKLGIDYETLKR